MSARFRQHQDVAVVEHDDATRQPREGGEVVFTTVYAVNEVFVVISHEPKPWDRYPMLFDTGSGWAARGEYIWRIVPLCYRCEEPTTGTPVHAHDDPLGREWCSEGCLDASAEASHEQRHPSGVAT